MTSPQSVRDAIRRTALEYDDYRNTLKRAQNAMRLRLQATPVTERWQLYCATVYEMCRRDPFFFLSRFCYTIDPTQRQVEKKVRRIPAHRFIWTALRVWQNYDICLYKKSRRILFSWVFSLAHYWRAAFYPGETILFHSLKASKSGFGEAGDDEEAMWENLLSRCLWAHLHLPKWLNRMIPQYKRQNKEPVFLKFPHKWKDGTSLPSTIVALPDNPEEVRSYGPSAIYDDEVPFQRDPERFWTATAPVLAEGVKYTATGSAGGDDAPGTDHFEKLVNGDLGAMSRMADYRVVTPEEVMPLEDSYSGDALRRIRLGQSNIHSVGSRFLVRRISPRIVGCFVSFRADPKKGKRSEILYRSTLGDNQYNQEMEGVPGTSDNFRPLWRSTIDNERHYEYDPNQSPPYDVVWVEMDPGMRSTTTFWQIVKAGPGKRTCQVRCLGEIDRPDLDVAGWARETFLYALRRFGRIPYRFGVDVAAEQGNRQTREKDVQVIVRMAEGDRSAGLEPLFPGFIVERYRISRTDGIDVISMKLSERLGEDEHGPVMGFVVSPRECPKLTFALRGHLHMDKDRGIRKKTDLDHEVEHVADTTRQLAAHAELSINDVLHGAIEPTPKPDMTPEAIERRYFEYQFDRMERIAAAQESRGRRRTREIL